jgi:hypothetical protein
MGVSERRMNDYRALVERYSEGKTKIPKHGLSKVLTQVSNPRGQKLTASASAQTAG